MRVVHETSVNGQLSSFFVELIIIRLFELKIIERLLPLYIVHSFINERFYYVNIKIYQLYQTNNIFFESNFNEKSLSLSVSLVSAAT